MTDWPREMIPKRIKTRPQPPEPGKVEQVLWYHVYCVVDRDQTRYEVRNAYEELLAQDENWERLCDSCGWFPCEGSTETVVPKRDVRRVEQPTDTSDTIVLRSAKIRIAIPRCRETPLPARPAPPEIGQTTSIAGYQVSAKICKGANGERPIYYLRSSSGEILSVAYDWDRWCHILGWFPLEGLEPNVPIPREPIAAAPAKPARPTGPHALNRHHYKSRDEILEPWIYCGRGTPLGNPWIPVKDDPEIRSTLASDPDNPEHRSPVDAITRFRRHLWDRLQARDPLILRELGKITAEHGLVCSCVPRPCHVTVIIKAWKWAKGRSVLDGYRKADGEDDPDWATETEAAPTSSEEAKPQIPVIERREAPKNLDLFGEP